MTSPTTPLHVTADLQLTVDGVVARIDGDGSRLTVAVDDAAAFAGRLREVDRALPAGLGARRNAVTRSLDAIDAAGLTVTVEDANGPLVTVGSAAHSRIAQLVVANPHVQFARRRESASLLLALVRPGPVSLRSLRGRVLTRAMTAVRSRRSR